MVFDDGVILNETKLRIIIVEDDEFSRVMLETILTRFGHDVRGVADGKALDLALADYTADIVVLDLNLPGEDGLAIAHRLRRSINCGIIMTTGRGEITERVTGFQSGADLYFVKPFDPLELQAALLSLVSRIKSPSAPEDSTWAFDPRRSVIRTPRGIVISLTAQESVVIGLLSAAPEHTVSRTDIFTALGHLDDEYAVKRVEVLFSRLRSKVRALDPESEMPIRARHSKTYAFLADLQQ